MKRYSTSVVIREINIKTITYLRDVHYINYNQNNTLRIVDEDAEKLGTLCTTSGNVKWYTYFETIYQFLKKIKYKLTIQSNNFTSSYLSKEMK